MLFDQFFQQCARFIDLATLVQGHGQYIAVLCIQRLQARGIAQGRHGLGSLARTNQCQALGVLEQRGIRMLLQARGQQRLRLLLAPA
ncbi:hypothetical protein D3C71_1967580 [compost metagenome]